MKTTKVISKYLAHYAENISPWLEGLSFYTPFQRCVVIPAFDENTRFIEHLNHQTPANTLIILILNCAESCTPQQRSNTLEAKYHLLNLGQITWQSTEGVSVQLIQTSSAHWLVWDITDWSDAHRNDTDRNVSNSLDTFVHGVGYARKLGMDSALQLFSQHQITDPFFSFHRRRCIIAR